MSTTIDPVHTVAGSSPAPAGDGQRPTGAASAMSVLQSRLLGPPRPVGSDPVFVAASLAELMFTVSTRGSAAAGGVDSVWPVITDTAAMLIPGAEQAGIAVVTAHPHHDVPAGEAANSNVQLLMKAQYFTGEGPCLDAAAGGRQVLVHDLHAENRWPRFAARTPWAVRSLLCTPLVNSATTTHVLVVLSTRAWAFDDTSARLAQVLAAHAALALAHAEDTRNLHAMALSRDIIGQAKGILMQRHQLTAEQAYLVLAEASNHSNIKLITVCQHLADTGELQIPSAEMAEHAAEEPVRSPGAAGFEPVP